MEDGIPRWLQHYYKTCCEKGGHHGKRACMIWRWYHYRDIIYRWVDLHMTFTQRVHAPKNSCFHTWLCKHQFPRSFYNTSFRTILNFKSCVWLFTGSGGVNMQLQVGLTFMNILVTPHFPSGFCTIRIYRKNATMCTRWAWSTSTYFWVGKNNKSFLMQSCLEFV